MGAATVALQILILNMCHRCHVSVCSVSVSFVSFRWQVCRLQRTAQERFKFRNRREVKHFASNH